MRFSMRSSPECRSLSSMASSLSRLDVFESCRSCICLLSFSTVLLSTGIPTVMNMIPRMNMTTLVGMSKEDGGG